jgi:SdrD B-like domain
MPPKRQPENALVIHVFAYPTVDEGDGPDDPGTRPLPGCKVNITRTGTTRPKTATTDEDGEARFSPLREGDYKITFAFTPAGFAVKDTVFVEGRQRTLKLADAIKVKEGGEVLVHLGATPKAGRVDGTVAVATGAAAKPLGGVRVEARFGGVLLDSATSDSAGKYSLKEITRPGVVEIRPQPSAFDGQGRQVRPKPDQASQRVFVPPDGTIGTIVQLDIEYEAPGAEIVVGAYFVERKGGQEQRRLLDGVVFELFDASNDQLERRVVTQNGTTSTLSGLDPKQYRLAVTLPKAQNGQRLQLTKPPLPYFVKVAADQRLDLSEEFEVRPASGSVLGSVVLDRDASPVPNVEVVVAAKQDPALAVTVETDGAGEYFADNLFAGPYRVALQQTVVEALGNRWTPLTPTFEVDVRGRATTLVEDFRLREEQHRITGQVLRPDGSPASYVIVQLFDSADPNAPAKLNAVTDENGNYEFDVKTAGAFFVSAKQEDGFGTQRTRVEVASVAQAPPIVVDTLVVRDGRPPAGDGARPAAAAPEVGDLPVLTEEVDLAARAAPPRPGYGAGAVGQTVERTLRDVLGWRPRANDPKGFLAALEQAFTCEEVQGHTECRWTPRSYAVELQADMGAITGAQASIFARGKAMLDQVLPLLEGLEPLLPDYDPQDTAAIRAIVRSELNELVNEFGVEGGPRVARVDQLLGFLLDRTAEFGDAERAGGNLGRLGRLFGLERDRINTIDEERNFTNFLMLADHVVALRRSWDAQRAFFDRSNVQVAPFLGTQLVLLSRSLEVITESVREVEFALDSVFIGPSERQTLQLSFPSSAPMFLSELLAWVERFAGEEGRQLIDEGGRQGVFTARPTIVLLQSLVRDAKVPPQDPTTLPEAYSTQRVQRALQELADQLNNAAALMAGFSSIANGQERPAPLPPPSPAPIPTPRRRFETVDEPGGGPSVPNLN